MANPTTNYGFVLPTPTDLVTDLPADFDVALQGVDTRLKALQPGTTLGDLAYSSATANTNTRLAVGSTGQVLTVAGGVPTWAAASGGLTYAAWTPTLTGITAGNGTTVARYAQSGKFVTGSFKFTLGSTSAITGNVNFTLPVTAKSALVETTTTTFLRTGVGYNVGTTLSDGSLIYVGALVTSTAYGSFADLSATIPHTWGNGDFISCNFSYEAA
jgi:hypothetical protein